MDNSNSGFIRKQKSKGKPEGIVIKSGDFRGLRVFANGEEIKDISSIDFDLSPNNFPTLKLTILLSDVSIRLNSE